MAAPATSGWAVYVLKIGKNMVISRRLQSIVVWRKVRRA
jgi:hypothetical protein